MDEIKDLDWLLFDDLRLARNVVNELEDFSPAAQLVSWHQLKKFGHKGMNAFLDDFEIIRQREPGKLRDNLCEWAKWYNNRIDEFNKTHSMSLGIIWDLYRETGVVLRGQTYIPAKLRELTDREFALNYLCFFVMMEKREDSPIAKFKEPIELVSHDLTFMHNVGRYHFKDAAGQEIKTFWDIREKEIPKFLYG